MKKFFVLFFVVCFLFQTAFLKKAEAGNGKLWLGILLTVAGGYGISVGKEEYDIEFEVLDKEYNFVTYVEAGVWDDINSVWISVAVDAQVDPNPETIVQKDIETGGWIKGSNNYSYWVFQRYNHHKKYITEYKTEERTSSLGYMGYVATGVGITLIIDYLAEKTEFTKRTGLEVQITQGPGYINLALAKRF